MERPREENGSFWQQLLQPMRTWLTGQQEEPPVEQDDESSASDAILFRPLDPASALPTTPSSFDDMTEAWIQRQCDALCFEQAHWYPRHRQVWFLEATSLRIRAMVQGRDTYRQELALQNGSLLANCNCRGTQRDPKLPSGGKRCRHVMAALLAYLALRGPQPEAPALDCICPITRQPITGDRTIYQCRRCNTSYSPEGWEFLQQADKGRCCSCHARDTIAPLR
ncbi:MAG TPA: SWIM zinc finger family protein [Chthonomonadaceae bacterium]|nr:SWIM zinc finger family protein [Chthonomonadaceae bacterium]